MLPEVVEKFGWSNCRTPEQIANVAMLAVAFPSIRMPTGPLLTPVSLST